MRNLRKLLMVICVFALLTVGCALLAYADGNDGTVAELNELIAAAEAAQSSEEKYGAIFAVGDYLNTKKIDTEEEGYADAVAKAHKLSIDGACYFLALVDVEGVSAKAAYDGMIKADTLLELFELPDETQGLADAKAKYDLALARALGALVGDLDENIETTLTTATNKLAINKVNRVLKECTLFGEDTLADIKAEFAELVAAHDRALAINYAALDDQNVITNYDLPIFFTENWEIQHVGNANDSSSFGGAWSIQLKGSKDLASIVQDESGNKFYNHTWRDSNTGDGGSTFMEHSLGNVDASEGLVFEFDMATFGDIPPAGIIIEPGGITTDAGRKFPPCYFFVNGNGDICKNDQSTVVLPGALIKGEWIHIILVFDRSEFVYKLYVEGEYVTEYPAGSAELPLFDHKNLAFRFSGKGSTSHGSVAYDNIVIYGGNSYRNHTRLADMTDDEKFIYCVDYLLDETKSISSKRIAYEMADPVLVKYWTVNEQTGEGQFTEYAQDKDDVKKAVEDYLNFDLDAVIEQIKKENIKKYVSLVEEADAIERKMDTAKTRLTKVDTISEFVVKNAGLFDLEADDNGNGIADYTEYSRVLATVMKEAECDTTAVTFITYMNNFEKAATIAAKERYFTRVDKMIDDGLIDVALIKDETNPERENFADLVAAYEIYINADAIIYELILENNSYKIIQCIGRVAQFTTEEEWLANREYIEKYLGVIEPIVFGEGEDGSPLYDTEYEGVEDAIEIFNEVYGFFYALLQDEHVAYLAEVLDLIVANDGYIEKMGMIAMIDRYLLTGKVDYTDERIISLLNDLDTCKEELVLREVDYSKLILQNSIYFVNLVERMRTADNYKDQKAYYDEAALLYFYLDTDVEGTRRAVEIFDEYKIIIERTEKSSKAFIDAVTLYSACQTEDEKYAALVECYDNFAYAEPDYEGMDEAMAEYQAAYDAYVEYAESVNSTLVKTGNAVGSVRANSGIVAVIAVIIKKLFGV